MAELPLDQGIPRLKQNEDRFDRFTNGTSSQSITHSDGQTSPTLRKFLNDKNTEINAAADGILAQSREARDESIVARDVASEARDESVEAKQASEAARDNAIEIVDSIDLGTVVRTDNIPFEVFINKNLGTRSLETLTGQDNPANITSALVNAALAANPDVKEITLLNREYTLNGVINIPNRDFEVNGRGGNRSRINLPNTSSGFRFRPTLANQDNFYGFDCDGINFNAIGVSCVGIDAEWPLLPYSLHKYSTIKDIAMSVETGGSFDRGIKLKHVQGSLIENLDIQNYRTSLLGVGVEYLGFSLANKIEGYRSGFVTHSVIIQPNEVRYIQCSGGSGSFIAGEAITSSSGGVGVVEGALSSGATASFVIEVKSGSWNTGDTIAMSGGFTGTIATTEIREWGSEGYYFSDFECVGVQRGIYWPNGGKIIKPGVLLVANGIHCNAGVDPIRLEFVSQIMLDGLSLYGGTPNMQFLTLVGCERAQIRGQASFLDGNNPSGTAIVAVAGDNTWGKATLKEINVQLETTNIPTLSNIGPGAINVAVEKGPGQFTPGVITASAQTGTITTFGSKTFRFNREGNKVTFMADIAITTAGTGAGQLIVSLPPGHVLAGPGLLQAEEINLTGKLGFARNVVGANTFVVQAYDGTSMIANGARILISGIYEIA